MWHGVFHNILTKGAALTASADVQEMDDYETGELVQIEDDPEQDKARQQVTGDHL